MGPDGGRWSWETELVHPTKQIHVSYHPTDQIQYLDHPIQDGSIHHVSSHSIHFDSLNQIHLKTTRPSGPEHAAHVGAKSTTMPGVYWAPRMLGSGRASTMGPCSVDVRRWRFFFLRPCVPFEPIPLEKRCCQD